MRTVNHISTDPADDDVFAFLFPGLKTLPLVEWTARRAGLFVALLDTELRASAFEPIDLLAAVPMGQEITPPEWVRFLAPGVNRARDGRVFNVADPAEVVRLSTEYKGAIDLLVDFEHQFDRSRDNGQPAPAAAWIKQLAATGPDGTPGIWAQIDWLPGTVELIRKRQYRYLSAAVAHDDKNNVVLVPRASLTNQPAMDTASALFSTRREERHEPTPTHNPENTMDKLLKALLAALGLPADMAEDKASPVLLSVATLMASIAKAANLEVSALSAMTADQVKLAFTKPLDDKIATLAVTAKVAGDATPEQIVAGIQSLGVDPTKYIARSVYDETAAQLATLTAANRATLIDKGKRQGKLSPKMIEDFVPQLSIEQLNSFLATAPVIVTPGGPGNQPVKPGEIPTTVAQLSAEDKAAARAAGVTDEIWLAARTQEHAEQARRTAQLSS